MPMPMFSIQQSRRQIQTVVCTAVLALALGIGASAAQADCSQAVAGLQHTVGEAIAHHSSFTSLVASPHNTQNTIAVSDASGKKEILNPLVVRCEGRLLGYIGRLGPVFVVEISATDARIVERVGPARSGQKTIPIHNLLTAGLVSSRRLHPGPVYGNDVSGFVAGKEIFGAVLPEA
jgi:hypothetical protein